MSSSLRKVVVALTLVLVLGGGSVARAWQEEGAGAGDDVPRVEANESFLRWGARASGPIGLVILALSIYLVALVVWMAFEYRRSVSLPEPLIREVSDLVEQKKFTEAYGRLAADDSFLARVLAAGVRKLPSGLPAAQRAMEMTNDDMTMEMEHRTTYLATVGTLGPMIGLVGTVYGMILSFRVIATAGASPQASQLAAGISTALFATLEGIALAVPAIAFYALFRNRISRISLEVSLTSETLLDGFAQGVRMPHPLAAAAAAIPSRPALPPSKKSD
ncbi:MAG: MotA/TolQ/ExbB proton channel family protein [Isosphaeraceae bacterium]